MPPRPQRISHLHGTVAGLLAALLAAAAWAGESSVRWQDSNPRVTEGSGPLTVYLQATPPPAADVTVVWKTNRETAVPGTDYVEATTTTVIPAGQVRTAVTVQILNDAYNSGNRTLGLQILSIAGATWGSPNYVSATIEDDDTAAPPATAPAAAWAPASTTVPAGAGPTGFALSLAYAWTQPISVQWQANPHSAAVGSDFAAASGTLTFAPGETAKDAVVDILPGATPGREFGLQILSIAGGAWGNPNYQAIAIVAAATGTVAAPTADPPAGTYTGARSVALATATAGAEIRYTLDGSAPSAASALYAGPVELPGSATLRAIALRAGWTASPALSAAYRLRVPTPTTSPAAGTYYAPLIATAAVDLAQAELRYTTDGTNPTAASPPWPAAGVAVERTTGLRLRAFRAGWLDSGVRSATYTLRVSAIAADLRGGTYIGEQAVTLATATPEAVIRYTLDGSVPTADSAIASGPIAIGATTVLRAVAGRDGWRDSAAFTATYTIRVAPVVADLASGTYVGPRSVALGTATAGAAIRYTLDGSAPTADSALYADPIVLPGSSSLRAVAMKDGWKDSAVLSRTYTLRVEPVAADLAAGTYVGPQTVALSTAAAGAAIRYTLDGTTPTADSALYAAPIALPGSSKLRAVAMQDGWKDSAVLSRNYTLRVEPVAASLPAGTYVGAQEVTLATPTAGAVVRYTLDGSAPTADSPAADGPILVAGNRTLRAVAMLSGWSSSAGFSAAYKLRVPAPVLAPPAGTYAAWPLVAATSGDAAATIRYATGTATPGSGSAVFPAGGLQVTKATTLNVIATRSGWTNSLATTAAYARDLPPVAAAVSASTDEDVAVVIVPAASDPDSAVLTWSIVAGPAHGALSGFDPATGAATYLPAADWNGADAYVLAVADALSAVEVAVTVTVRPVDDPATAVLPAGIAALPGSDAVIDIAAADADSAELIATLAMSGGTVRLPAAAGLSVVAGDPAAGSATVAVRGATAAIAAALRAVVVRADEPFAGGSLALQLADPAGAAAAWSAPVAALVPAAHAVAADGQTAIAAAGAARRLAGDRQRWSADGDRLATASYAVPTAGAAPAALEFDLDVARAGSYLLWARAGAAAPAVAALGVSCDGAGHGAVAIAGLLPASAWSNDRAGGGETAVAFPAPGRYRLRLEAPASAAALDGILLLRDDAGAHADGDPWLPDGDGTAIVIDAGAPHRTHGAAGRRWQVAALAGRPAVRSLPDIDGWSDPAAPGDASASYEVLFMRAGTYRVWLLGDASDDKANSVHLGLDGQPLASARGLSWLGLPGWMWSSWSSWTTVPTITVAAPGVHTVQLWSREDGSAIGQIRLSLAQSWTMPGEAVAATPRGLPFIAAADGGLALSPAGAHEARASGASAWTAIPGGSGGARQLLPDADLFFGTAQAGTSPRLSWHAWFPAAGTYRFWVRAVGPAATGDSLYYGLDGAIGSADLSWLPVDPALAAWGWSSRLGGSAGNATIVVPAAGYHTVNVWGREDGLALDRVLIQPAAAAAPSGSGPADSGQDLPAPAVSN